MAVWGGSKDVTEVLLEAGASLSTVDTEVINPSVKRRQSILHPSSDKWGISSKMKKITYQTRRQRSCFNRVIELNQKMLILKWFVTKIMFYVMMTTEMFINYFSKIKLCCLWRFDDKMSVIYWEIICAKILFYIYCFRVIHLYTWQHWRATKMWQRCYWRQGHHYP
jgi:hypothetical protein